MLKSINLYIKYTILIFISMKKNKKKNVKKRTFKSIFVIVLILTALAFILISKGFVLNESIDIEEQGTNEKLDKYSTLRDSMIEDQLKSRDIYDEKVLEVMNNTERHKFVPKNLINKAYGDHPLPIGYGQTISQPYIVALMTQTLQLDKNDRVLEIGTGSGYQAAILSKLVKEVYTIEIVEKLAESAKERLNKLGYKNVEVKHADGYFGWEEKALFDAIIITAATNHVPPPLLKQLKNGGKLIIPLGSTLNFQTLTLVTKKGDKMETKFISGVRFVPLTGEAQKD